MPDRAAIVEALRTEREYLSRQPKPNERRLAEVDAQLDVYSDKPVTRQRETAKKA